MTTLLVVDDDEATRDLLKMLLEADGYRVLCAADGVEACHLLESIPLPSLILLDRMMPEMDGDEFVRVMRARGWTIPIVMMSGHDSLPEIAARLGVDGYLTKPVGLEELLQETRRWTAGTASESNPRSG